MRKMGGVNFHHLDAWLFVDTVVNWGWTFDQSSFSSLVLRVISAYCLKDVWEEIHSVSELYG